MSANEELVGICRRRIESLETWLRRLTNDVLSKEIGSNYFNTTGADGQNIIKSQIRKDVEKRLAANPEKFSRLIDATLLDHLIDILCNPKLYELYFKAPLQAAFDDKGQLPEGYLILRNNCERLIEPRNNLSHANPISERQAEQVLCITGDIIESIKTYYRENGMEQEFNCPLILSIVDHKGVKRYRENCQSTVGGGKSINFANSDDYTLYPGDQISISVDVDSSFDGQYKTTYSINNYSAADFDRHFSVCVSERDIGLNYSITVNVINIRPDKMWARIRAQIEDSIVLRFKVLPTK